MNINEIYRWKPLLNYSETFPNNFHFYFIFYSKSAKTNGLMNILKNCSLDYPILIDKNGDFERLNPHLPKNKAMYTFLLDENNNVILVGNPLYNKEIEKIFYKITQEKLGK